MVSFIELKCNRSKLIKCYFRFILVKPVAKKRNFSVSGRSAEAAETKSVYIKRKGHIEALPQRAAKYFSVDTPPPFIQFHSGEFLVKIHFH